MESATRLVSTVAGVARGRLWSKIKVSSFLESIIHKLMLIFCVFLFFPLFSSRYWLTNKVHIKRPTTGLLMYTLATRFCNQIYLYGFWPFPLDQNQNPVKYHYYDSLKYGYTSQASPHTMPLEFKALKSLHEQGALKLTVGQCDGAT